MTPDPDRLLGGILLALAAWALVAGGVLLVFPARVRAGLQAFPRSKWPGWALTAAGLFWVAWVVQHAALGRFESLKPLVPYEIFMANLEAGNDEQLMIKSLVESYGLQVGYSRSPGVICAVSTLEFIQEK